MYLALCHYGKSNIQTISKITGIARQDIYRLAADLVECGLIEAIISNPITYKAIPIEEGVSFLLRQKQEELATLELKTKSLLEDFKPRQDNNRKEKGLEYFVLIPSKKALIYELKKSINNTHASIDVSTSWKRFNYACYYLSEELVKAWGRDVKGRVIIEKTKETSSDFVKTWKTPYAKIEYLASIPRTVMAIYDKKEVYIYTEPKANLTDSPALWSNNPGVLNMSNNYFETLWNTGQEKTMHINQ